MNHKIHTWNTFRKSKFLHQCSRWFIEDEGTKDKRPFPRYVHFKKFIHTNVLAGNAFLANTVPSTAWGRPYRAVSWDLITAVRRAEWPCVGTPTGTASLTITRRFFRTVKRVTGTFRSTNFTLDRTTVSCHIISTIV